MTDLELSKWEKVGKTYIDHNTLTATYHHNKRGVPEEVIQKFEGSKKANTNSTFNNGNDNYKRGVTVTGMELLSTTIEDIPCLLEPIFHRSGLGCIAGASDTGKSMLLRQLAISVAARRTTFLGFTLNVKWGNVIYVCTEESQKATQHLLQRQAEALAVTADQLCGLRFVYLTENALEDVRTLIAEDHYDLIIIDAFGDVFSGDLKDTSKIRSYLNDYQVLSEQCDCCVIFLHHTGKRTENFEPSKNNLLSGQGFEAKLRTVIELRQDFDHPQYRHLCIVKGNYLPTIMKSQSYVLSFSDTGFIFEYNGERVPFTELAKPLVPTRKNDVYERAKALVDSGMTQEQAAKEMGYANKSAVSKILKKGEYVNPPS